MRRAFALLGALALALPASQGNGAEPTPPTAERQILGLEEAWNQAHRRGDADALERLWAPNLTVIVPEMKPFSKSELLDMWRSMKVTFTRYETSAVRVAVSGDTAVVTGQLKRSRDFGGRVREEDWLFTKTYARVEGNWRVVAYHASATPAP